MKQNRAGFTFVEVILASFILLLIVGVAALFWWYTKSNFDFSLTHYRLINDATTAVNQITNELRETRIGADGAYPLADAQDNAITFYADVDNDNVVEKIHYFLNGQNLVKGVTDPIGNPPTYSGATEQQTYIAENVATSSSPLFLYYNGDWPGDMVNNPLILTNRQSNTRFVTCQLLIAIKNASGLKYFTASASAELRNLKDNL